MSTAVQQRPLVTVPQTAERLNVSEKTVRRLIDADILPALRVGGSIRVDKGELEDWLYAEVGGSTTTPRPLPAERRAPESSSPAVEAQALAGDERG